MSGRGDLANPGVQFRDMIRSEIGKQLRAVDQVSLATVASLSVGPEVLLDGMAVSVPVMWAAPTAPAVGQRVVCVSLVGGQQWIVASVVGSVIDVSQLTADLDAAEADIVALEGDVATLETDVDAAETAIGLLDGRLDTAETDISAAEAAIDVLEALFAIPGYLLGGFVKFTADGSFTKGTWPGLRAILVEMVAGGAAGGGAAATTTNQSIGSGGGAGAWVRAFILVSDLDTSEAVTIGGGGSGNSGADGNAGGDSVFDTISGEVRADGGLPGTSGAAGTSLTGQLGGVGGAVSASSGDLIVGGSPGGPAWRYSGTSSDVLLGDGGSSHWGGGGRGRLNAAGEPGEGPGAGGGGACNAQSQSARSGGAGFRGECHVHLYF